VRSCTLFNTVTHIHRAQCIKNHFMKCWRAMKNVAKFLFNLNRSTNRSFSNYRLPHIAFRILFLHYLHSSIIGWELRMGKKMRIGLCFLPSYLNTWVKHTLIRELRIESYNLESLFEIDSSYSIVICLVVVNTRVYFRITYQSILRVANSLIPSLYQE